MPIRKINFLHKGVHEGVVLVTLICMEVGHSNICNELRELLVESGFFHEGNVRSFARPDSVHREVLMSPDDDSPVTPLAFFLDKLLRKRSIFLRTNF